MQPKHLITMALNEDGTGVVYLDGRELQTLFVGVQARAGDSPLVTLVLPAAVQGTLAGLSDGAVTVTSEPPAEGQP